MAGLLHYFQTLKSAGMLAFVENFKRVVQLYRASQRESTQSHVGQVCSLLDVIKGDTFSQLLPTDT